MKSEFEKTVSNLGVLISELREQLREREAAIKKLEDELWKVNRDYNYLQSLFDARNGFDVRNSDAKNPVDAP